VTWISVQEFPAELDLRGLSRFLSVRGIAHRVSPTASGQQLAILDPLDIAFVTALMDVFVGREQDEAGLEQAQRQDLLPRLKRGIPQSPVTSLLVLLCALGTLVVSLEPFNPLIAWLSFQEFGPAGQVPLLESLAQGQVWRLISPAFLHFGLMHLLMDALLLWYLGRRLELLLGSAQYLLFVLVTGVVANLAQYLASPLGLFGGISGVDYAFVGLIGVLQWRAHDRLVLVAKQLLIMLVVWLLLCMSGLIDLLINGKIANAAHLGGILAGAVFGQVYLWWRPQP